MASAKRDIRHIINSFSEDLIQIAQDIARQHVDRAVAEWQSKSEKLEKVLARKSVQDEKALRNQQALERIDRVAARRREREEKKAAERALRLEQRMIASSAPEADAAKKPRRARRGSLLEGAAKKEPAPAPLFVHKRRRDGEIQQLKRTDEEAAEALNGALVKGTGAAVSAAPVVPEQLRLGF